ncbi:MAG: hypothetical protein GX605_14350, partial [Chloroflexi bacterium]|nr:hypothetical protein [Chloroflexota bacterium]
AAIGLRVANPGGQPLQGQVSSPLPFLRVTPTRFVCPPRGALDLQARLDVDKAPTGAHEEPAGLLIDSDAGQSQLAVRWSIERPLMEVSPTSLRWGAVAKGDRLETALQVRNSGSGRLVGKAQSTLPYLQATPELFSCDGGQSVELRVTLSTADLPLGLTSVADALQLRTNGGSRAVPLRVEMQGAVLGVETPWLYFGAVPPGDVADATVRVSNRGVLPLEGWLAPLVDWLQVAEPRFAVEPGQATDLRVAAVTDDFDRGMTISEAQAVRLESNGGQATLGAGITLLMPELAVDAQSIDLGLVARDQTAESILVVQNRGTGVLEWAVHTGETWLEMEPAQGVLGPGREETVILRAYPLGLPAEAEEAQGVVQVASNGGRVFVQVAVGIASPRLFLETLDLDLGLSMNYAPLSEQLNVFNRGTGRLEGQVEWEAGWLQVEPAHFVCETGMGVGLRLLAEPVGLPPDVPQEAVLRLHSNGGDEQVRLRLQVEARPLLEVTPLELTLRPDPQTGVLGGQVELRNLGYGLLDVQMIGGLPWLAAPRTSYQVRRGRVVRVPLQAAPDVAGPLEGWLTFSGGEQEVRVLVRLPAP